MREGEVEIGESERDEPAPCGLAMRRFGRHFNRNFIEMGLETGERAGAHRKDERVEIGKDGVDRAERAAGLCRKRARFHARRDLAFR